MTCYSSNVTLGRQGRRAPEFVSTPTDEQERIPRAHSNASFPRAAIDYGNFDAESDRDRGTSTADISLQEGSMMMRSGNERHASGPQRSGGAYLSLTLPTDMTVTAVSVPNPRSTISGPSMNALLHKGTPWPDMARARSIKR